MKLSPQILPEFMDVAELSSEILTSPTLYADIYAYEHMNGPVMNNYAWLIDERASLSEFIDALGQADAESDNPPLNLYKFYAARNINFPAHTVRLMNEIRLTDEYVNNLATLLRGITSSRDKYIQHAVYLQPGQVTSRELADLRREIIQQFIYLRMYLPVIIAESYVEADKIFQAMIYGKKTPQSVSVFGTKKSGKSTLINALLGDEYAIGMCNCRTLLYSEEWCDAMF